MTATPPEDIQISLGTIGSDASTASTAETYMIAGSTGILVNTNGVVTAPRVDRTVDGYTTSTQDDLDWSNIADISKYYQFGSITVVKHQISNRKQNIYRYLSMKFPTIKHI